MAQQFKLYHNMLPFEKSMINFVFTEHLPDCFKCYLVDYNIDAIMPLRMATNKSSIKSPKTLAPLGKPMVGKVETLDNNNIIISMAYIDKESDEYKCFEANNYQIRRLIGVVKKYATMNKQNYIEYWEKTFYPLDITRTPTTSLFDHVFDNINAFDEDLSIMLQSLVKHSVIPTHFKMISNKGNTIMKQIISKTLDIVKLRNKILITMETPPNYIIKSIDTCIDEKQHVFFIKTLKETGKEFGIVINSAQHQ